MCVYIYVGVRARAHSAAQMSAVRCGHGLQRPRRCPSPLTAYVLLLSNLFFCSGVLFSSCTVSVCVCVCVVVFMMMCLMRYSANSDPTDFRSALCKHEKGSRCVNCRPIDGGTTTCLSCSFHSVLIFIWLLFLILFLCFVCAATGKGPLKFLCQHGPGQKCINCLGVSREEVMAEVKAKVCTYTRDTSACCMR